MKEIFAGDNSAMKFFGVDVIITSYDSGRVTDIKLSQGEYIKDYVEQNFMYKSIKHYNTSLQPNYYFNGNTDGPLCDSDRLKQGLEVVLLVIYALA